MKLNRLSRLVKLLGALHSGSGRNAESLADHCGVGRRTIFRDLAALRDAGVPLEFDEHNQRHRIRGDYYLPAASFTAEEALALVALCYELGERVPFMTAAASAALKLESVIPQRLRDHVRLSAPAVRMRLEPNNLLVGRDGLFPQLVEAINARRCVRIRYDSLTEWEVIATRLSPYRLLFSRRSWYVVGRSSLHRETRTFNVGRILELTALNDRFQFPRGFTLDRYLRNAWHLIPEPGPDRQVVVRFDKQVAQNVAEVAWHKTQQMRPLPEGKLEYRVTVSGLQEISWWILGYGDRAEVLEPAELRDIIAQRARGMLAKYDPPVVEQGG